MSDVKITIGALGVFDELDAAIKGLEKLEKSYEGTRQAGQNIFNRANAAALEFTRNLERVDGKLNRESNTMRQVSAAVNGLGVSFTNATKNQAIFAKDQHVFGKISKDSNAAAVSLKNFNKQQEAINQESGKGGLLSKFGGVLSGLGLAVGAGVAGLFAFISRAKEAQKEAEAIRTTLNTAFKGDTLKTSGVFQALQEFAARTPFTFKEITESFTKLVNRGFEPTIEQLTLIGDLAASQGKSFDQLAEAILDAQTGEFERLKEFGIKAALNGDKVTLSFKGQKQEIANTEEAIRSAIIAYGALDGVTGSLAAQSETLKGVESNVGDAFDKLFRNLGSGTNAVIKPFQKALADVVNAFADMVDPTQKASDQARELQTQFNAEVEILKVGNFTQKERAGLINDLNSKYGVYGFNLNSETASLNDIATAQARVNEEFTKRIVLLAYEEDIAELAKKGAEAAKQALAAQVAINQIAVENKSLIDETGAPTINISGVEKGGLDTEKDLITVREKGLKTTSDYKQQQIDLKKATEDLFGSMGTSLAQMQEIGKSNDKTTGTTKAQADALKRLIKEYEALQETLDRSAQTASLDLIDDPEKRLEAERELSLAKVDEMAKGVQAAADAAGKEIDIAEEVATIKAAIKKKYQEDLSRIIQQGVKDRRSKEEADRAAELKALEDFEKLKLKTLEERQAENQQAQVDRIINRLRVTGKEGAEAAAEGAEEAFKSIGQKLQEAFNLDDRQLQAISGAVNEIVGGLQEVAQARVDEAEAAIQAAEDKVDAAQTALEQELEFARLGFASNVDLRRQELEEAKKAQETAEAEKKKAVKAQLALDTAVQASGLITSAVKIFEGLSGIPIAGPILAGIAIAAMFGTFVAAKKKAFDAVKLEQGGQGAISDHGVVMGASHRDGGVPLEVEGGEFFTHDGKRFAAVNKRMTAKHFALLRAVNMDDRGGMAEALSQLVPPRVALDHSVGDNVVRMQETIIMREAEYRDTEAHKRLDTIAGKLDGISGKMRQDSRQETSTHIIIRKGNKVTRIRK